MSFALRQSEEEQTGVLSPCINICTMEAGFCIGCFRNLDEISCWSSIGDDAKRLILASVAQRRETLDPDIDLLGNCAD
jgi:predicted Fe-S protein YdhL (DUF1289 family)